MFKYLLGASANSQRTYFKTFEIDGVLEVVQNTKSAHKLPTHVVVTKVLSRPFISATVVPLRAIQMWIDADYKGRMHLIRAMRRLAFNTTRCFANSQLKKHRFHSFHWKKWTRNQRKAAKQYNTTLALLLHVVRKSFPMTEQNQSQQKTIKKKTWNAWRNQASCKLIFERKREIL